MASQRESLSFRKGSSVQLLLVEPHDYSRAISDLMRVVVKDEMTVIYVSINKPASVIAEQLSDSEINAKNKLFFIDCATAAVNGESDRQGNTLYISAQNLTGLSLTISELLDELPGRKVVVFDSMNALVVYNPLSTVEKFAHFISNKVRLKGSSGVLISTSDLTKDLLTLLEGVCDKTVEYG